MEDIKTSRNAGIAAIILITVIFLAVISPWKGLGILTLPLILLAIGLWFVCLFLLVRGLSKRKKEKLEKVNLWSSILLGLAFFPVGFGYMVIDWNIKTTVSIHILNQSEQKLNNILVYGSGDLFENTDTLKVEFMEREQVIKFKVMASTEPQKGGGKRGHVKIEFDNKDGHFIEIIAGEFSVYPLNIQQKWEVIIDEDFFNDLD